MSIIYGEGGTITIGDQSFPVAQWQVDWDNTFGRVLEGFQAMRPAMAAWGEKIANSFTIAIREFDIGAWHNLIYAPPPEPSIMRRKIVRCSKRLRNLNHTAITK